MTHLKEQLEYIRKNGNNQLADEFYYGKKNFEDFCKENNITY